MTERREPSFRGLVAWQKADELASLVFKTVDTFAPRHRWLALQAARAAVSVAANIAEGYGRGSLGDYVRFLDIARGSLAEVEYYVYFFAREGLVTETTGKELVQVQAEASRVLRGLTLATRRKTKDEWDRAGGGRNTPNC